MPEEESARLFPVCPTVELATRQGGKEGFVAQRGQVNLGMDDPKRPLSVSFPTEYPKVYYNVMHV